MNVIGILTGSTFTCCLLILFNYCHLGTTEVSHDSRRFQLLSNRGELFNEAIERIERSISKESVLNRHIRSANAQDASTEASKLNPGVTKKTTDIDDAVTNIYDDMESVTTTLMPNGGMIEESATNTKEVVHEPDLLLDSVCEDDIGIPSPCDYVHNTTSGKTNENSMCQIIVNKMKKKEKLLCKLLKQGKSTGDKSPKSVDDILSRYLPSDYNRFEVPIANLTVNYPNGTKLEILEAVPAKVFINIREVRDLDELNEEMTLDMDLIVIWIDGTILRNVKDLANLKRDFQNKIVLDPSVLKKIWSPDLYFEEMVSMTKPTLMGQSETVVLFPGFGLLVYRTRAIVKLTCPMKFHHYPADTQECVFSLKSFSYTTNLLTIDWKSDGEGTGIYLLEVSDTNFDFQVASYSREELAQNFGPGTTKASEANYTNLIFTIRARRKLSYHLVQTYIPSVFFVIVTWMCFLIPIDMFEARVGIAMSTLLTLTSMFSSVRESTPIVSYVKAIDTWMVMCIIFIFSALGAFIMSAWMHRMICKLEDEEQKAISEGIRQKKRRSFYGVQEYTVDTKKRYLFMGYIVNKYPPLLLSFGFIAFNIIYWSWLIVDSEHFNWSVNSSYNNVED